MLGVMQESKLELVQAAQEKVCTFLKPYLPLANAHNSDFIVVDHWNTNVPDAIGQELLQLSARELASLPSGSVVSRASTDCVGSSELISARVLFNDIQLSSCMGCENNGGRPLWDKSLITEWTEDNLASFVERASLHTLPHLGVLTQLQHLIASSNNETIHIANFMSPKKSHEVHEMARVCSDLARHYQLTKVVDIGSGRGYLGCQLALTHNLHVLGVDSSSSNSQSAASRTAKLGRQWEGLVRNAQRRADAKKGVSVDQSPKMDASRVLPHSTDSTGDVNAAAIVSGCATTAVKGNTRKLVSVSYVPVTCFITPEISLSDLLSSHCNWPLLAGDGFLLTGLHTCGELAPSTLQLFHTSSETTALCNVGCCYHLLEEAFLRSPYANQDTPTTFGFPMSSYLKDCHCQLGRNARMLAAQAPDRLAQNSKLPDKSIFWRALLQVILHDTTGELSDEWQVGKIAAKCDSFTTYVQRAFTKLAITQPVPTPEQIEQYEIKYADYEQKMAAFFQLKAVLAPCIEALLLLDRLCFLLQQENIDEAHLVQLFDPVTSPRCYAIIAAKQPLKS